MSRASEKEKNEQICKSVIATMSNEALLQLRDFIPLFQKYKKYNTLFNTYIKGTRKALAYNKNGKIYCDYRLEGAVTGRLSNASYKAKQKMGISFHTLPREDEEMDVNIREFVIAPPGYDFITVDQKAMELRVVAHLAKEENMLKAFRDKVDLHTYSASMVFNKKPEKVTKLERQICKEVSFLIVYGGSEFTLASKRRISLKKAKSIIEKWLDTFPRLRNYMALVYSFIERNEYAYTIFGRRRHLPNVRSYIDSVKDGCLRQGLNFTVQSAASDILVCSLIGIDRALKAEGLDAYINGTVHDSVEVISKKEHTQRVLEIIYDQMVNYPYIKETFGLNFSAPFELEIFVGPSFGKGEKIDTTIFEAA
jgi:DNA polymerase-1